MRKEQDFLGEVILRDDFPFGINTFRAMNNFNFSDKKTNKFLFKSLLEVKKACAIANLKAELIDKAIGEKIIESCDFLIENFENFIPKIHPFQGGAGTSLNMAANELIANFALKKSGFSFGDYNKISPLNHINLSQSTNDVFLTAVKITIYKMLDKLHGSVEKLLSTFLKKEKEFSSILKIGRTELQDAMPISLGQEFGAWAEAISRFRWRLDKAKDWIRDVNIGGTAIGTSINADRDYLIFVVDELRKIVKIPISLARNLIDATQNADQISEVSSLMKTGAVTIKKIASDLRLLSMGPNCGISEINIPPLQAGSSIMPGKVNPVMLEAIIQVSISVMFGDGAIPEAISEGNLELQQFMPFIAHTILENGEIFASAIDKLSDTIINISANKNVLSRFVENSYAIATLLTPILGFATVEKLLQESKSKDMGFLSLILEKKLITKEKLDKLLTPEVMASPGLPIIEEDI